MSHYEDWLIVYNKYLLQLYNSVFYPYLTLKEKQNISFDKFCQFVYDTSSGDISSYS